MSISLDQTHSSPGDSPVPAQPARASGPGWLWLLFGSVVLLLLVAAVVMRLYHLDSPFDRDSYDEGVYWQSLRSMLAGQSLYKTIFYSQPPLFLLSAYPGFALFGGSLWSARFGITLVSLLGFPGAYLLGRTLAGRLGALVALLLLLVDPLYLAQSQTIQAEASSVAFTFLAIAFAFLWWKQPDGWRGICWAALCGLTFSLSVLCKLLCITTIVPIALLMLARAWQIKRGEPGTSRQSWLPLLVGCGIALLTLLVAVAPYLGSFKEFWAGVWTFHIAAGKVSAVPGNLQKVFVALLSVTTLAALYGSLAALLRRDWRVLPLLAWLVVTLVLLYRQQPLFEHHMIALEPSLVALALLGVADPAAYKAALIRFKTRSNRLALLIFLGALVLVLAASGVSLWKDVNYYQGADARVAGPLVQQDLRVANDLRQAIAPDQWVITDGQFIAGLADRSTPPALVDTSTVRLQTGYVTLAQLEQEAMNPRVHAILFYTDRFYDVHQAAGFHPWVAEHFHLLHQYSESQELWVR
jgi:4-amino-4-deoxy-L-arabinose transferase-like glycosyltransferase